MSLRLVHLRGRNWVTAHCEPGELKVQHFQLLFVGSQDPWFSQYFSTAVALRMRQYSGSILNSLGRTVLVPFHSGQVPGSRCTKLSKLTHGRYLPRQKACLFPYCRNSKSTEGCAFVSWLTTLVPQSSQLHYTYTLWNCSWQSCGTRKSVSVLHFTAPTQWELFSQIVPDHPAGQVKQRPRRRGAGVANTTTSWISFSFAIFHLYGWKRNLWNPCILRRMALNVFFCVVNCGKCYFHILKIFHIFKRSWMLWVKENYINLNNLNGTRRPMD